MFEKVLTYANHLGLYADEIDLTGEQIGNFPQAFTPHQTRMIEPPCAVRPLFASSPGYRLVPAVVSVRRRVSTASVTASR
jgi:hypothetical protein